MSPLEQYKRLLDRYHQMIRSVEPWWLDRRRETLVQEMDAVHSQMSERDRDIAYRREGSYAERLYEEGFRRGGDPKQPTIPPENDNPEGHQKGCSSPASLSVPVPLSVPAPVPAPLSVSTPVPAPVPAPDPLPIPVPLPTPLPPLPPSPPSGDIPPCPPQ